MFNKKIKKASGEEFNLLINNSKTILEDLTGIAIDLSKYNIKIAPKLDLEGRYSDKTIEVNKNIKIKEFKSVAVHELSHGLQDNYNLLNNVNPNVLNHLNKEYNLLNIFRFTILNKKYNKQNAVFYLRQSISEAFAYFNDSFTSVVDNKSLNLYEKRTQMAKNLASNLSFHEFRNFRFLIKNLDFETNPKNGKLIFNQDHLDPITVSILNKPDVDLKLGSFIALISFAANDFSILKTSESLFKPWKNILYNLNNTLNDANQWQKIENNLINLKIYTNKRIFTKTKVPI